MLDDLRFALTVATVESGPESRFEYCREECSPSGKLASQYWDSLPHIAWHSPYRTVELTHQRLGTDWGGHYQALLGRQVPLDRQVVVLE